MTASPVRFADVAVDDDLPPLRVVLCRADLVRYAGASGDFNSIHWSDRVARTAGLPGVVAHGMLTMAVAARVLTEWSGDPGAVEELGVRFARPVVVPDDEEGATLQAQGRVTERLEGSRVRVVLDVRCGEERVLGQARAVLRLS